MAACAAPARGIRQSAPHTGPPFNDTVDNNPCGRNTVATIGGVDVSAAGLCLLHYGMKNGQAAIKLPIVST